MSNVPQPSADDLLRRAAKLETLAYELLDEATTLRLQADALDAKEPAHAG